MQAGDLLEGNQVERERERLALLPLMCVQGTVSQRVRRLGDARAGAKEGRKQMRGDRETKTGVSSQA